MFYVRDNIAYNTRLDITKLNNYTELCSQRFKTIVTVNEKYIVVDVISKPSNNAITTFIDKMSHILDILNTDNKLYIGSTNCAIIKSTVYIFLCSTVK